VLISVAVPVPALDLLTYRVPEHEPSPVPGARVIVPIGSRTVTGVIVETDVEAGGLDGHGLKAVRQVLDRTAFVPGDVIALARWTAEYYACGIGETMTSVLPPKARGHRPDARKRIQVVAATAKGRAVAADLRDRVATAAEGPAGLTARQRGALDHLIRASQAPSLPELAAQGVGRAVVARLVRHGLAAIGSRHVDRDPFSADFYDVVPPSTDRRLTSEQEDGLSRLSSLLDERAFQVALVHGVTGSGKTEVYLRLASRARDAGRTVLMLVPEIALTSAVARQFRQVFGEGVAIQHSGLSEGERHDQWQRIRGGMVNVVIGTRSAVFAPLDRLGLVIVDEEHDASYKQEENPRYNGRDVAIVRAERAGALVVLGSATPSMESYFNAERGRYRRVRLARRVLDRPLPEVRLVDMRDEYAAHGPDVVISRPLREAVERRLGLGQQALVLLNRRGFATAVFCRQCAGTVECPNCSVSLVVHGEGAARRARCHYCNFSSRVPVACPQCAAPYMAQAGFGTERVEAEIRRQHPGARVARLDRDAVRRRGAMDQLLSRFWRGEIDVLVGTQMIAKGHDFPGVTLVGVVSADVGLGVADFRAAERTFQLIAQVAGRAGRGDEAGEAVVQTLYPGHYSIQLACRQDYGAFFERELAFRRSMRYPPLTALVNVVVRARTFQSAMADASGIAARIGRAASSRDLTVLGPAPAPLGRLRGDYRAQLLVKGVSRRALREAVVGAVGVRSELARRTIVDVDPLSVL
jgi:primosomal protein N' (replication factor Y)